MSEEREKSMTIHDYEHKTQYYETDQMGIVHHSNYIRWFEEARTDVLEQIGLGYDEMERLGIVSPVTAVSCEYKTMTRYGETVRIHVEVLKYDGVRLHLRYRIEDKATGELRCTGESRHCFLHGGKPTSLQRKYPEVDRLFRECLPAAEEA